MSSLDGSSAEMLGDTTAGYIVNVVREEGEEAVRIPPSISVKLKPHQVWLMSHFFIFVLFIYI